MRSEPWWPSSSSLAAPPTFLRPLLSSTFHRIPVTAGHPLCGTFSPPPEVLRPLPGPHCTPGWLGAHRSGVEPRWPGIVPLTPRAAATTSGCVAVACVPSTASVTRMATCAVPGCSKTGLLASHGTA